MENKGYADFFFGGGGGANKVYYGECGNGDIMNETTYAYD